MLSRDISCKFYEINDKQNKTGSRRLKCRHGKDGAQTHAATFPSMFILRGPNKMQRKSQQPRTCSIFDIQADVFSLLWAQEGEIRARPLLLARFSLFKKVQSKAELFLLLYPRYPCSFHLWLRTAWYRVKSERLIQRKEGTAQWLGRAECKSPWEPAWAFLKKIAPNIPVKRLISSGGCSFYQVGDNHSAYDWCFKW